MDLNSNGAALKIYVQVSTKNIHFMRQIGNTLPLTFLPSLNFVTLNQKYQYSQHRLHISKI